MSSQLFNSVSNRGFISCENKIFTFLFAVEWIIPEQCPWMLLNSPYGSAGIQLWAVMGDSLVVYFYKECIIVLSLAKSYLPLLKFNGTNLNKAILSILDWKAPKLYFSWFHKDWNKKERSQLFFQHISYLKKQSHTFSFWNTIFLISSCKLYTDFQKRANHCCQLLQCK